LTELRPADAEPPESVIEASNVLWRLPEAHEVLKSVPSLLFRNVCNADYVFQGNDRAVVQLNSLHIQNSA
jgi:hypothetical protein